MYVLQKQANTVGTYVCGNQTLDINKIYIQRKRKNENC